MSKHTPGPWVVHTNNVAEGSCGNIETLTGADHYANHDEPYVAVVGADGEVVCDNAHYYSQSLHVNNAYLIAAAPDLLDTLVMLGDTLPHVGLQSAARTEMLRRIDAAIARAKGESS